MSGCPACEDELIVFELGGVEIDHCVSCKGTWLDGGELEMIVEFAGAESASFSDALDDARVKEKSGRRCPRCSRRLRAIEVVGQSESGPVTVELDRCPKGHGLWFDSGEMKQVVESLHDGGEAGAISRFFAELYHHEFQEDTQKGEES